MCLAAELKLSSWIDLEKRIWDQTFTLSPQFTFPVEEVSVDLTEIDDLVKKASLSRDEHK